MGSMWSCGSVSSRANHRHFWLMLFDQLCLPSAKKRHGFLAGQVYFFAVALDESNSATVGG